MNIAQLLATARGQNLEHLRLIAAAAVIVSHAWPLAHGPGTPEPLAALTGHSLGGWAVALFFFLSGLLIYTSAERRSITAFAKARARRILPGLGAALLVTVALALLSGAAANMAEVGTYLGRGITLFSLEHRITGAFEGSPYPLVVNGPLWSLSHEIMAYVICLALVKAGALRSLLGLGAVLAASLVLWAMGDFLPARLAVFAPLWLAFVFGMGVGRLAARLPASPLVAIALALLAPIGWPFAALALGYGALVLALGLPALPRWGDISFGLYIYGWPVAQMVLHLFPQLDAPQLALASLVATIPFAAASWRWIERPSIAKASSPRIAAPC